MPGGGGGRGRPAGLLLLLLGWGWASSSSSAPPSPYNAPASGAPPSPYNAPRAPFTAPASSAAPFPYNAPPSGPGDWCPEPCQCSSAARTVKCVNRNLSAVPVRLPSNVRILFLTGNRLGRLAPGAFARRPPLAELAALNLSGSRLEAVPSGAFAHLPALRQLDLSRNPLGKLGPRAFAGPVALEELALNEALPQPAGPPEVSRLASMLAAALRGDPEPPGEPGHPAPADRVALRRLRRLELAGNELVAIPRGMFAGLPALAELDLGNNSLLGLGDGAGGTFLAHLPGLRRLRLAHNALKGLDNATLAELRALPALRVNLDGNPWACDCQHVAPGLLAWLRESEQVEGKAALACAFPARLRARPLLQLNLSELDCGPAPLDLQAQLQTSYVFLGIVLALIGAIFLLVLYLNRKGIKKWIYNIRDACRDHMEGYHYRYEINADPRLTNLSSNSDV
ncbi:trophoblast glycoprotein [Tachyglossus aculeatus]|uniref:trophoblast glycoprotein n=1 Tax=Tachyglossus aculeatus TaxID=9261 RepID=UPI0018F7B73E|nr:trophoblast glycoprotein [Tachyglossus aculeatus]